jgi:hypothetical protein
MGVRKVVSSLGFGAGLVDRWIVAGKFDSVSVLSRPVHVEVNLRDDSNIENYRRVAVLAGNDFTFVEGDSARILLVGGTDMLFIGTSHVYDHFKRDLTAHHSSVRRYIVMHDTSVWWMG